MDFGPEDERRSESTILGAFKHRIVHFDFQDTTDHTDLKSYVTFNGVNPDNIIHGEKGIVWKDSLDCDDCWKFNL